MGLFCLFVVKNAHKRKTTNREEVGLQVRFTTFMKDDNTDEYTHALCGLCPSKHTNNVVKGKHNNELIVL